jgi:tetratricopeptide (TPR) repeat protein
LTLLGFIDQARARVNEALLEARRLGHAHTLAQVLNRACEFSSPHEAQRYAEEAMALSIEHGFPYWLAVANVNRGRALTALGQTQEGVALVTQGLLMLRAAGHVLQMSGILDLAKAHARLGQPVEGLNCLAEAAQIIESTNHRVREAEVYRVRGDLLNATGDLVGAEQCYHQALAIAQRQSAKLFELRAATSLARLWRDQGKRAEARDLLVPIYGWFTEGFDTPVLKEAKALLEQFVS